MEYMAWVCYLNAFFLVADITIYPRDGVNVPNPSTNPRLRYMRSLRYVLPNSSPGIIDAGSSTLDLSIERLTRENQNTRLISLPSGQIYDGRGAIRQELPGVDSRRLQPVEYGYLGSDGPAIESARQRRANSRILSPRRRTREHIQSRRVPRLSLSQIQTRRLSQMGAPRLLDINQNYYHNQDTTVLRYPGQTTHRRSAVLRTGAPRQLRTRRQRLSAQIGSPSRSSRSDLRTPLRANQRRAPSYPLSRGQIRNIPAYLVQFGYLNDETENRNADDRRRAIREFQQMAGLPVTGVLNTATIRKMNMPRCGIADVIKPHDRSTPYAKMSSIRDFRIDQPLAFNAPGRKWDKNHLTYKFTGYTRQLSEADIRTAWRNALDKWEEVSPLRFTEIPRYSRQSVDIRIEFGSYDHGDGYPFDGPGKILAHAFFPAKTDLAGDTHFDDDERWTVKSKEGTNLEIVAVHEIGHAIGLGHSDVKGAIMGPFYQGYKENHRLHEDDVKGVQSLYGRNKDNHNSLDEFECQPYSTTDNTVSCP